ncbi:hypothetical protein [Chamaesiphon sp. VAR_48_metabat_403]|uniref:hypothetical protein n=1 Tax=Chamaesiphon sp. VAR_48_metabat_403 TaxID=2964700 RepID=UPI00286DEDC6|nr:hypothetical protein [Chamaesiphon sp. VAR_48_metabat_403]
MRICGNDNFILSVFLDRSSDVNAQLAVEINLVCSESNRSVAPPVTTSNPIFMALKNMHRSIFSSEDISTIFTTDSIGDRYW